MSFASKQWPKFSKFVKKTQEYALQFRGIPRFFAATAASTNFFNFQLITFVVFLYNPTLSLHLETFYECIKLMFPRCNVAYRYVFLLLLYFVLCFEIQGRDCHLFAWVAWNNLSFSRISYITQAHSICESVYINMRQIIIYSTDMAVKLKFASVTMKI